MKSFLYCLGLAATGIYLVSCSEMDDTYKDFLEDGEIIYVQGPDSLRVHPGRNRIRLSWLTLSDPTVSKAKIYWDNRSDSVELSIDKTPEVDTVNVMITDLEERTYTFEIYTYDDEGHSSVSVTAAGEVYGEDYINTLLNRLIGSARFENNTLKIAWGSVDETAISTEILYTDTTGENRRQVTPTHADSTLLVDYDFEADNSFEYRTLYLPDSLAIDTFYAAYQVVNLPVEYDKSGWTATASSYDERHGTARAPGSAIDNDPATIWVNSIDPQTEFPHSITVDMGNTLEADGLSFIVQDRNETPQTIEIIISEDHDNWTSMGKFILENTSAIQYIDFPETQDMRYFEVVAIEPHGDTKNVVIGELGAYRR